MTERQNENLAKAPRITEVELRRFGFRIVQRRKEKGWKQRELARRMNIEPSRLSRLERGIGTARLEELARLRETLGGSIDELLFGAEPVGVQELDRLSEAMARRGYREEADTLSKLVRLLLQHLHGGDEP
jgi:transcriptional regulator with XRE-family HTH domain